MVYHILLSVLNAGTQNAGRGAGGQDFLGVSKKQGKGVMKKSPSEKDYLPAIRTLFPYQPSLL